MHICNLVSFIYRGRAGRLPMSDEQPGSILFWGPVNQIKNRCLSTLTERRLSPKSVGMLGETGSQLPTGRRAFFSGFLPGYVVGKEESRSEVLELLQPKFTQSIGGSRRLSWLRNENSPRRDSQRNLRGSFTKIGHFSAEAYNQLLSNPKHIQSNSSGPRSDLINFCVLDSVLFLPANYFCRAIFTE